VLAGGDVRPAAAQIFESIGERALGMGGAFVAVADDATATYWNPAGLATGRLIDSCLSWSSVESLKGGGIAGDPAGIGSTTRSFCLAVPSVGFSLYTVRGTEGGPLISPTDPAAADRQDPRRREVGVSLLTTRQFGLTLVQSVMQGFVVGGTVKYVRGTAGLAVVPQPDDPAALIDAASELEGRTSGAFDADLGVMVSMGALRVGVTAKNLVAPSFETEAGGLLHLQRQVRVGVALTPWRDVPLHSVQDGWLIAFDADTTRTKAWAGDRRMLALGLERWAAGHRVGLRGGVRVNTIGPARAIGTAGISVGLTSKVLIEAHIVGGGQGRDRGWGVGTRAGF
jgi:hypothetical protein